LGARTISLLSHTDGPCHRRYKPLEREFKESPLQRTVDLASCSPALLHLRDLKLAVPGTLLGHEVSNAPRIASFAPKLSVMASKQRPRRLKLTGSDGKRYTFLL